MQGGRFHDCIQEIEQYLEEGGEDFAVGGRHPLQARCVHLARGMGCAAFLYDMQGGKTEDDPACYGDGGSFNYGLIHGFSTQRPHMSSPEQWGTRPVSPSLIAFAECMCRAREGGLGD